TKIVDPPTVGRESEFGQVSGMALQRNQESSSETRIRTCGWIVIIELHWPVAPLFRRKTKEPFHVLREGKENASRLVNDCVYISADCRESRGEILEDVEIRRRFLYRWKVATYQSLPFSKRLNVEASISSGLQVCGIIKPNRAGYGQLNTSAYSTLQPDSLSSSTVLPKIYNRRHKDFTTVSIPNHPRQLAIVSALTVCANLTNSFTCTHRSSSCPSYERTHFKPGNKPSKYRPIRKASRVSQSSTTDAIGYPQFHKLGTTFREDSKRLHPWLYTSGREEREKEVVQVWPGLRPLFYQVIADIHKVST
ncbi:uncharacterized protein LACBIDRAFT_333120, partial [Laccaria bicolor S238N-H82]